MKVYGLWRLYWNGADYFKSLVGIYAIEDTAILAQAKLEQDQIAGMEEYESWIVSPHDVL